MIIEMKRRKIVNQNIFCVLFFFAFDAADIMEKLLKIDIKRGETKSKFIQFSIFCSNSAFFAAYK